MLRRRAGSGGISPHALYATPYKQETRRRRRTLFPPPTQLDPMMQQAVSRYVRAPSKKKEVVDTTRKERDLVPLPSYVHTWRRIKILAIFGFIRKQKSKRQREIQFG